MSMDRDKSTPTRRGCPPGRFSDATLKDRFQTASSTPCGSKQGKKSAHSLASPFTLSLFIVRKGLWCYPSIINKSNITTNN